MTNWRCQAACWHVCLPLHPHAAPKFPYATWNQTFDLERNRVTGLTDVTYTLTLTSHWKSLAVLSSIIGFFSTVPHDQTHVVVKRYTHKIRVTVSVLELFIGCLNGFCWSGCSLWQLMVSFSKYLFWFLFLAALCDTLQLCLSESISHPGQCWRIPFLCVLLCGLLCTVVMQMKAGSDHSSAAKGSAVDLEVTGSGSVGCRFSILSSFFTIMQFSNRLSFNLFLSVSTD